jgi:hypothetical protein
MPVKSHFGRCPASAPECAAPTASEKFHEFSAGFVRRRALVGVAGRECVAGRRLDVFIYQPAPQPGELGAAAPATRPPSQGALGDAPRTEGAKEMSEWKAMTLNLTEREMAVLEELSRKKELTKTAIVRQALRLYQVIDERLSDGKKLFFEDEQAQRRSEVVVL